MIYDYIIENYDKDEPIFLSELPGNSKDYLRQEMKQLVDDGKIERLYNGVYFLAYTTILGTKGKVSIDKFIEKKYTRSKGETTGYITGIQLANNPLSFLATLKEILVHLYHNFQLYNHISWCNLTNLK